MTLVRVVVLILATSLPALAQETAPPDPAGGSGEKAANETSLTEQTIYVPYTKLRSVFEKDGRGVFLPYDQFQKLWSQARRQLVPEVESEPPVKAFITEVASVATVGPDVVRVEAQVSLEVLTPGWHKVPLRLSDAALLSARFGDQPARIIADPDHGYFLILEKKGEQPEQQALTLVYAKAFAKAPGRNQVAFQAPQAPVNRWEIRIPESGVKVNIRPMIAASEVLTSGAAPATNDPPKGSDDDASGDSPDDATEDPGDEATDDSTDQAAGQGPDDAAAAGTPTDVAPPAGTRILAFVGAAPTVEFDWTPKSEGATGLSALANVQTEQKVTIDEGVISTSTQLVYEISRARLNELRIEVPTDHKVTGVFDPNVRQWEVQTEENVQRIVAQLFEPTQGTQRLVVELEKFMTDVTAEPVTIPVVRALDVARQQGVVMVSVSSALRGEVTARKGLLQLDSSELPAASAGRTWQAAFRYPTLPFELTFQIDKVQPRITTRELVEVYLEPRSLRMELLALLTIERAGVFQLELNVPPEFEVRRVLGRQVADAQAPVVDTFHRTGDQNERLQVNLAGKAIGKVGLWVELERRLDDPNLLTPTGEKSTLELAPPRVTPDSLELVNGSLIVYAPESLQVTPTGEDSLRAVSFSEAVDGTQSLRDNRFPELRPILAYASSRQAARLTLEVERRKPFVTARQLLEAQIESGVVQYRATFFYDIRYSGVNSLRVDIPAELAPRVRNDSPGIRESVPDPLPDDVPEGYTTWTLQSRGPELFGQVRVQLSWEDTIDELDVGGSTTLTIPRLVPRQVDRAWGQILLQKAENLDLHPDGQPQGLRPIDPQVDVMPGGDGSGAARAFEFHDEWSLVVQVTRYQLEEVKRTSVERGLVRIVVTREVENRPQQTLVQALFRIRSVRQRLAVKLPADVIFAANPLRVNGQVVGLERGDQGEFYVPLTGRDLDEPLLLELRYSAPGSYRELAIPGFPSDPAVQKVYLCAYLPEELAVIASGGPWTSETLMQLREMLAGIPAVRHTDEQLLAWVGEGFDTSNVPDFPTEGTLHVYSTLRPPDAGTLRLTAIRRVVLHGSLLALIVGVGLLLLARPLRERLIFLVLLLAGLVFSGVFLPTLAIQLLNGVLAAAVFLVVALWIAVSLGRSVPRLMSGMFHRPAVAMATPTATSATLGDSPTPGDSPTSGDSGGTAAEGGENPFSPRPGGESGDSNPDEDAPEGGAKDE